MEKRNYWIVSGEIDGLTVWTRIGICTHMVAVFLFRKKHPYAENVKVEPSYI